MKLHELDVDGASVTVREWGDGVGRPLFFWHALGLATSGNWLGEVAPTLVERHGLRVLALDGPGFGASPPLPPEAYAVERLVELGLRLLDRLGLERVVFCGHSWGGTVGTHLAAAAPERIEALVLLDSGHMDFADMPGAPVGAKLEELAARRPRLDVADRAELEAELRQRTRRWSPELPQLVEPALRAAGGRLTAVPTPETGAAVLRGALDARPSTTWPAIRRAGIPVLLLLATEPPETKELNERVLPAFLAALPEADVRWLDGAGHDLLLDAGPRVALELGAWLGRA